MEFDQVRNGNPVNFQITDEVFCLIENDRKLLKQYLELLADGHISLKAVNSHIAQEICRHYGLKSTRVVDKAPKSKLIQSFTELM